MVGKQMDQFRIGLEDRICAEAKEVERRGVDSRDV